MPQQTAIEKLIEVIEYWNIKIDCPNLFKEICDQAKEKEKEDILDAFMAGLHDGYENAKKCQAKQFKDPLEYFKETFKH